MARKSQYGITKQLAYRDQVFGYSIEKRDLKKPLVIASLGGRDAIWEYNSIENKLLRANPNATLALIECGSRECRILIKDLQKQGFKCSKTVLLPYRNFIKTFVSRKYKHSVEIYFGTMKNYLNYCVSSKREHDIINLDYYGDFYKFLKEDIKIIRDNGLLKSNGDLFVTAPDPRRTLRCKAIKNVIKLDPQGKKYETGMRLALRNLFQTKNKVVRLHSWQYRDSDNLKALTMNVARLRLVKKSA